MSSDKTVGDSPIELATWVYTWPPTQSGNGRLKRTFTVGPVPHLYDIQLRFHSLTNQEGARVWSWRFDNQDLVNLQWDQASGYFWGNVDTQVPGTVWSNGSPWATPLYSFVCLEADTAGGPPVRTRVIEFGQFLRGVVGGELEEIPNAVTVTPEEK